MPLDLAFGLTAAWLLARFYGTPFPQTTLLLGAVFAVLPDIDFPIEWLSRGTVGGKKLGFHREITHYPLIYLPIIAMIAFLAGSFWAILLSLGLIFHFLHDSLGMGWGVKWLWPFDRRNFKFFSDKNGAWSLNPIAAWEADELSIKVAEHGDPDWIKHYLNSRTLLIEAAIFILAIIAIALFRGF